MILHKAWHSMLFTTTIATAPQLCKLSLIKACVSVVIPQTWIYGWTFNPFCGPVLESCNLRVWEFADPFNHVRLA